MKYSAKWAVALSVTAAAVLVACGGGGLDVKNTSNVAPPASVGLTVAAGTTVAASPVAILASKPLTFATGVAAFGTTSPTTVNINTAAAIPTFAVSDTASGNTATGEFLLGSCIFKITKSNYPASSPLAEGKTVTVTPCEVKLNTSTVVANGVAQSAPATLTLGAAISNTVPTQVVITSAGQLSVPGTTAVISSPITLTPVTGGG